MLKPSILHTTPVYFKKILDYHKIDHTPSKASIPYINGFKEYNYLIDINSIFSNNPSGDIVDRTQTLSMPFRLHVTRPWIIPSHNDLSLNECMTIRVNELVNVNEKINLFWSGGIDSTAVVVAFLLNSKNISQLRILYSTLSIKENPSLFLTLKGIQQLEMVEFSGDVYLNQNLDGIFVTGDAADDLTASLDLSFYEEYGFEGCNQPWQNLFYSQTQNLDFVSFCEQYFQKSGRDIKTLLEARWWFYTNCKIQKFPALASYILQPHQPLVIGFFDFYEFEHYMFWNTDGILETADYSSYKNQLKKYIFSYDNNINYLKNKTKFNSNQLSKYRNKKIALLNQNAIMLLSDGTRIQTDNLPFLSERDYRLKYQNSLDYLFDV